MQKRWHRLLIICLCLAMMLTLPAVAYAEENSDETAVTDPVETDPSAQDILTDPTEEGPDADVPAEEAPGADEPSETVTTGWVTNGDGTLSYYVDGAAVCGRVLEIEGCFYGFDWSGRLYTDCYFDAVYDNNGNNGVSGRFRAKSDGTLYVNEWYTDAYGGQYYYGQGGLAPNGFVNVDGVNRYFYNDGQLATGDQVFRDHDAEGNLIGIFVVADGIACDATADGWHQAGSDWCYTLNGELVAFQVMEIDGVYYGFDGNGIMWKNASFSMSYYDPDTGNHIESKRYHAKADGPLCVNEWYTDEYGVQYYYGEGGVGVKGFVTIDGVNRYFWNDGQLAQDTTIYANDGETILYIVKDSVAYDMTTDGWHEVGSDWYYVRNGELCSFEIVKIGNFYYAFDHSGKMIVDQEFWSSRWDYENNTEILLICRAKADGTLYSAEWYADEYGNQYYYTEGGVPAEGFMTVDGVNRYFYHGGSMAENTTFYETDAEGNPAGIYKIVDGVAYDMTSDGWYQIGEKWYYVSNGRLVENKVIRVGNYYYGFNWNGVMYADTSFEINYYGEDGDWKGSHQYRAKANGVLYAGEWYTDDYDNQYYYTADGTAADGFLNVDGVNRYFWSNGHMVLNDWAQLYDSEGNPNGVYVVVDGVAYDMTSNGWHQAGEDWYLVSEGKLCCNEVVKVGNYNYGFNWNGRMYTDTSFGVDLFDEDDNWIDNHYYRAKTNGILFAGEWYTDDNGNQYYYTADSTAAEGFLNVDGVNRYFWNDGQMAMNTTVWTNDEDGNSVISYKVVDGVAYDFSSEGWHQIGEEWYYVKNGRLCENEVVKVGNYYYGFDWNGIMYEDTQFNTWADDGTGNYHSVFYRAKAGGQLYSNEWYQDDYDNWYYYGDGGAAAQGFTVINGTAHFFENQGRMVINGVGTDENTGTAYYIDADGVAFEMPNNAWTEAGGARYYVQDGKLCTYGIYEIDGSFYFFHGDGRLFTNGSLSVRYTDENEVESYVYIRARNNGVLYANEWFISGSSRYYYGDRGIALSGVHEVDGNKYYFSSNGRVVTNQAVQEGENCYYADSTGALTELKNNAWTQIGKNYFYVLDGELCRDQVYLIHGAYYGFDADGRMYESKSFGSYYVDEEGNYHSGIFRAKSSGALYVNTWYQEKNGDWYYYGAHGLAAEGVVEISGKPYLFAYEGKMETNTVVTYNEVPYGVDANGNFFPLSNGWNQIGTNWCYVRESQLLRAGIFQIGGSYYCFSDEGVMYEDVAFEIWGTDINGEYTELVGRAKRGGALYAKQWYQDKRGNWYYYGEGGQAAQGIVTIFGTSYYFYYEGRMSVNEVIVVDEIPYKTNAAGVLSTMPNNAWTQVGKNWYYVRDGKLCCETVYRIGGKLYGFAWHGKMYTGTSFEAYYIDEEGNEQYGIFRADKSGVLLENQWHVNGNRRFYYGENGVAAEGLTTVNGVQYWFNYEGELAIDTVIYAEEKAHYVDKDGKLHALTEGWNEFSGEYLYVKNGVVCTSVAMKIDGKFYAFNYAGWMVRNQQIHVYNQGLDMDVYCRAKADGTLYVNEWYQQGDGWYYYGANGAAARNVMNINGVNYCFSYEGRAYANTLISVDDATYKVDKNMVATKLSDGWVQFPADGEWAYVENGELVRNELKQISGKYYVFNDAGKMLCGGVRYCPQRGYCLINPDGTVVTTKGWVTFQGEYYYISDDITLHEGILELGGKKYYMEPAMAHSRIISRGYVTDGMDAEIYIAATNGVLTEVTSDGFYPVEDGGLCYIQNGEILKEQWFQLNGFYYYADEYGIIAHNGSRYVEKDDALYLFDVDGKLLTGGWQTVRGIWYYTDGNGIVATDITTIDGKDYAFDYDGWLVTDGIFHSEDGDIYLVDSNGVVIAANIVNGWNNINGEYYYFEDDYFLQDYLLCDTDGRYYYLNWDGKMVTNSFNYSRYFGANGVAKTGWFKVSGVWYYGQEDGVLLRGLQEINGQTYYFNEYGQMMTGSHFLNDKYYHFGSSGTLSSITDYPNGWTFSNGEAYYFKDGKPYTGWTGDRYVDDGLMVRNEIVPYNGQYYYLGNDGKYARNEFVWWDGMNYATASGALARDTWMQIDGDWYYFDGIYALEYGVYLVEGEYCIFEDGVYQGKYTGNGKADGWVTQGKYWYYSNAGEYVTDSTLLINGKWYAFDYQGRMITNAPYYFYDAYAHSEKMYYYDANGIRAEYIGWKYLNGEWYYFDKDHSIHTSWLNVNGKYYYCYSDGGYAVGYRQINGKLYYFDTNGALVKEIVQQSGWFSANGEWYYFENGTLVGQTWEESYRVINGAEYYFIGGRMVANETVYVNHSWRFASAGGQLITKQGWYHVYTDIDNGNEYWIYVQADGTLATGAQLINGTEYYFTGDGIWWSR